MPRQTRHSKSRKCQQSVGDLTIELESAFSIVPPLTCRAAYFYFAIIYQYIYLVVHLVNWNPVSGLLFWRGFVAFESIYLYLVWLHLYKPSGQQVIDCLIFFYINFSFSCDLHFQRYERAQIAVGNWEDYISATAARTRQTYLQCKD